MSDPTQIPKPDDIRSTKFTETSRFQVGVDAGQVALFKANVADWIGILQAQLADERSKVKSLSEIAAGIQPHDSYEFGETVEALMDRAQTEADEIIRKAWEEANRVMDEAEHHREMMLSDIPPRIDPHNVGGSIKAYGDWLRMRLLEFIAMRDEVTKAFTETTTMLGLPAAGQTGGPKRDAKEVKEI